LPNTSTHVIRLPMREQSPHFPLLEREVEIINTRGLHARAAAKVVKLVEQFDAEVTFCHDGQTVSASSIMDLLLLAAAPGSRVLIQATGPQAQEALDALQKLISERFGEPE